MPTHHEGVGVEVRVGVERVGGRGRAVPPRQHVAEPAHLQGGHIVGRARK